MELPLKASDEPNKIFIQMYYAAAIQAGGLKGKRVLEVSCGHGGRCLVPDAYAAPRISPTPDWN